MNPTTIGLLFGTILGVTAAFGGALEFFLVLLFAALGAVIGRVVEGKLDLTQYLGARGRSHK